MRRGGPDGSPMVVECGGDHPLRDFVSWNYDLIRQEALQALFDLLAQRRRQPVAGKATGTGKSVVIAFLIKQLLSDYPKMRVLVTAPNRELIDQDVKELTKGMA